ncbi:hypothetical protein BCR35DRAFT_303570 [Leucosporidium creatinivorum]|uniref:Cryptic POLO box 1 (CPB1) domain-containing protein n=1 Tax=Leucosporidium creatinivorum TaxID=106004 RepID=A0A1Y2FG39_9BASI|nr:hypothetical protein BCR35DRAFT_303570 [Leucosporidium creatinivorum]
MLDLRERSGVVLVISGDGESVSLFRRGWNKGEPLVLISPDEVYSFNSLPKELEKPYALAAKFVNGVRSRIPRITVRLPNSYPPSSRAPKQATLTIFSDSPASYSVSFPPSTSTTSSPSPRPQGQSLTVRVDPTRSLLLLHPSSPTSLPLPPSPDDLSALPPSLRPLIHYAFALQPTVTRLVDAMPTPEELARANPLPSPLSSPRLGRKEEQGEEGKKSARERLINAVRSAVEGDAVEGERRRKEGSTSTEVETGSGIRKGSPREGQADPTSSPGPVNEEEAEEDGTWEEQRRCLVGAGWIIRRRLPPRSSRQRQGSFVGGEGGAEGESEEQQWSYQVLFNDGEELLLSVDGEEGWSVSWKGRSYPLAASPLLPSRIKRRLGLVGEMLELFGD